MDKAKNSNLRKYIGISCSKCKSLQVIKTSGLTYKDVYNGRQQGYLTDEDFKQVDGMISTKQLKFSFKCLSCGNEWSILSKI